MAQGDNPRGRPGFAADAHRQSALAATSPYEPDDQAFADAVSSFGDEADLGRV
ncbi:antitoxin MazE-like protein [Mycobacterium kyorinense]|uniref:antitoxin MazE-like protein n=1 Tax=Mycobacterium kyorinense TaxID=487514 RepID=UPI000A61E7E4|nr:antitoxin MazE-like protein [Mycobacterium kyorinense]